MESQVEQELRDRIVVVEDFGDDRLRPYRNLRERTLRGESLFIAEGALVVERLLRSPFEVETVLITRWDGLDNCLNLVPPDVPIFFVDEQQASENLVGFEFVRGILAVGRRRSLPTMLEGFESFFERKSFRKPEASLNVENRSRAWVVLPDATKPDNLGLAFRCAAALDAEAVVLGEQCCDPFSRRALRVSMGGVLQTPIYQALNLQSELEETRKRWGVPFFATILDDNSISSYAFNERFSGESPYAAFVFGNEYFGLSPEMVALCDHSLKIPMRGDVDSLNLGVSIGIFLYEFNRRNLL